MMQRHSRKCCRVLRNNGEDAEIVGRDLPLHKYLIPFGQRILAEADLDRDLPIRGRADLDIVVCIRDQAIRGNTESQIVQEKPQERVRVEQQPHSMYSLKSS